MPYIPIVETRGFTANLVMMPLVSNIPTGKPSWKIVKCPICGAECWERPEQKVLYAAGIGATCTMCALKEYFRGDTEDERNRRVERKNH